MIRFIDLGKQIAVDESDPEYPRQFAWYDTIYDRFQVFNGWQVFDSWEDFEQEYFHAEEKVEELQRYRSLCPEWVFK